MLVDKMICELFEMNWCLLLYEYGVNWWFGVWIGELILWTDLNNELIFHGVYKRLEICIKVEWLCMESNGSSLELVLRNWDSENENLWLDDQ